MNEFFESDNQMPGNFFEWLYYHLPRSMTLKPQSTFTRVTWKKMLSTVLTISSRLKRLRLRLINSKRETISNYLGPFKRTRHRKCVVLVSYGDLAVAVANGTISQKNVHHQSLINFIHRFQPDRISLEILPYSSKNEYFYWKKYLSEVQVEGMLTRAIYLLLHYVPTNFTEHQQRIKRRTLTTGLIEKHETTMKS